MEWSFTVRGLGDELISRWDAKRIGSLPFDEQERLRRVIDHAGFLSAKAQGLGGVITDMSKLRSNGHTVYLAATKVAGSTEVQGLLKVGYKNLFIRSESGSYSEIMPLCVLDFYVHESCQRVGLGAQLMAAMMDDVQLPPHAFGYDRPSPKLIQFLKKHYGLADYVPQSNNFVVFRQYFSNTQSSWRRSHGEKGYHHRSHSSSNHQSAAGMAAPGHRAPLSAGRTRPDSRSAAGGASIACSSGANLSPQLTGPSHPRIRSGRHNNAVQENRAAPEDKLSDFQAIHPNPVGARHATYHNAGRGQDGTSLRHARDGDAALAPEELHRLPHDSQQLTPSKGDTHKPRYGRRASSTPSALSLAPGAIPIANTPSPVPLQYQTLWTGHPSGQRVMAPPSMPMESKPGHPRSADRKVLITPPTGYSGRTSGMISPASGQAMGESWPTHVSSPADYRYYRSPIQVMHSPVPSSTISVTPAKAMALQHRAGMGAKNALAW